MGGATGDCQQFLRPGMNVRLEPELFLNGAETNPAPKPTPPGFIHGA
jgi:hypothetical protein